MNNINIEVESFFYQKKYYLDDDLEIWVYIVSFFKKNNIIPWTSMFKKLKKSIIDGYCCIM
jgi:hypothetical protein